MKEPREQAEPDSAAVLEILLALRDRMSGQQTSMRLSAFGDGSSRAPIHLAEQASDNQEISVLADRLTASSQALADINAAIKRIQDGHFNQCEECGQTIGGRRLKISPWAAMCVSCQKKAEEQS